VDFEGTDGRDGILVGEPVYGANWWLAEGEDFVKADAPHVGGGSGSQWYGTLDEWSAAFPAATTISVGYSLGSGIHGGGVIDSMTYGEHVRVRARRRPVLGIDRRRDQDLHAHRRLLHLQDDHRPGRVDHRW
jgi:hypothetical protein